MTKSLSGAACSKVTAPRALNDLAARGLWQRARLDEHHLGHGEADIALNCADDVRLDGPRLALTVFGSAAFGTTPEFWLSAQEAVDLYAASKRISKLPKPLPHLATG